MKFKTCSLSKKFQPLAVDDRSTGSSQPMGEEHGERELVRHQTLRCWLHSNVREQYHVWKSGKSIFLLWEKAKII